MNPLRSRVSLQSALSATPWALLKAALKATARAAALLLSALLLSPLLSPPALAAASTQQPSSQAFASAQRKIAWLQENGRNPHPSTRPTVLTAEEWDAYLNQGGVNLPNGVSNVRISSQPADAVRANADVNFDRLTNNRTRNNPLLALFTGIHHVTVTAQASAAKGIATVRIQSVTFDGVTVPRIALEYFADRYLRPRYGNAVALDSTFPIRSRIDTAVLGPDRVTITQR